MSQQLSRADSRCPADLHVSCIEIHDTYAVKHLKLGFGVGEEKEFIGQVCRISGANGQGKSSVSEAVFYLVGGGTDPEVIRRWRCTSQLHADALMAYEWIDEQDVPLADEMEGWVHNRECPSCKGRGEIQAAKSVIEITLSDTTTISKTTRLKQARRGSNSTEYTIDLLVTQPDGQPRDAPQTYIRELFGDVTSGRPVAIDPSVLLSYDTKTVPGRRALGEELMKVVHIAFTDVEIKQACLYRSSLSIPVGHDDTLTASELINSVGSDLSLDDLKKVVTFVTKDRTRCGAIRDDTDGAVNRLQKALPAGSAEDCSSELREAEEFRRTIEAQINKAKIEVEQDYGDFLQRETVNHKDAVAAAQKEADDEIADIRKRLEDKKGALRASFDKSKGQADEAKAQRLSDIDNEAKPHLDGAIAEVERLRAAVESHVRAVTLKQQLDLELAKHRAEAWKYEQLTSVLSRLEAIRINKLNNLPVAGLEFEDGIPYLDGIQWQNVNLARQVEAVLQICCLRSGKVPLVIWDNCEHGDDDTRAAIEFGLIKAGYQLIELMVVAKAQLTIEMRQGIHSPWVRQ